MIKQVIKKYSFLILTVLAIMPMFLFANQASAITSDKLWGSAADKADATAISDATGMASNDPRIIVANVIRGILGFLGIIAVVIIVMGGYEYMTSGGSDEKAKHGRTRITNGVIGLLIILAAYGIASFIISATVGATRSDGSAAAGSTAGSVQNAGGSILGR